MWLTGLGLQVGIGCNVADVGEVQDKSSDARAPLLAAWRAYLARPRALRMGGPFQALPLGVRALEEPRGGWSAQSGATDALGAIL